MSSRCRTAALAIVAAVVGAAPAAAADYCVGVDLPGCSAAEDLRAAVAAAEDGDRVFLGAGADHLAPLEPVAAALEIAGARAPATVVAENGAAATLTMTHAWSRLSNLVVVPPAAGERAVTAAGALWSIEAAAPSGGSAIELLDGGRLADGFSDGPVVAVGDARVERTRIEAGAGETAVGAAPAGAEAEVVVENVEIVGAGAVAALEAGCGAGLAAHHVSVTGSAAVGARAVCEGPGETAALQLRNSRLAPGVEDPGEGAVTSAYSAHAEDPDIAAEHRLGPGAGLTDAGDPAPLAAGEGSFDVAGEMRVTDGNGDGVLRRDVGAREAQPPAIAPVAGNVLRNPGAEAGPAAGADLIGPVPPDWTRLGGDMTSVPYGTLVPRTDTGDILLPTRAVGATLGAGTAFFSGGGTLLQRIDLSASAREVDAGGASATLGGLLGGFATDEDAVRVDARFLDPEGRELGSLAIGPVGSAGRAGATALLHRSQGGSVPPRTRAVDVRITGTRHSGLYTDAYADNLSLALSVPAAPVDGPVDPGTPPVAGLKPFSGLTVLSPRLFLTRPRRVRVRVACASATVGACEGSLELSARPRRRGPLRRVGRVGGVRLTPGERATVALKVRRKHARRLARRKRFGATLRSVARDGQGLERSRLVPLRVLRSRRW